MTLFIFTLTLRQLAGRKSTLLLVGLSALCIVLAVIFRLSNPDVDPERWTANVLLRGLLITAVLPLTALLLGTSVIGDEIEDGTALYLLTKPLQRWQIMMPKLAAAWLVTCVLTVPASLISSYVALQGRGGDSIIWAFPIAIVLGSLAYVAIFVMLSVVTSRALIAGLVYVFIWEGAVTSIFTGTRYLSVRHYTLGVAHWLANTNPLVFDSTVSGKTAIIMLVIVIVGAIFYANRRLQRLEMREPG